MLNKDIHAQFLLNYKLIKGNYNSNGQLRYLRVNTLYDSDSVK